MDRSSGSSKPVGRGPQLSCVCWLSPVTTCRFASEALPAAGKTPAKYGLEISGSRFHGIRRPPGKLRRSAADCPKCADEVQMCGSRHSPVTGKRRKVGRAAGCCVDGAGFRKDVILSAAWFLWLNSLLEGQRRSYCPIVEANQFHRPLCEVCRGWVVVGSA